jgi:CRP/FNR family transcriptional regulator
VDLRDVIRGVDLFEGLTNSEYDTIVAICQQREYRNGEIIAVEGEIGEELFIVMDGTVEILVNKDNDSPIIVVHLGAGQITCYSKSNHCSVYTTSGFP